MILFLLCFIANMQIANLIALACISWKLDSLRKDGGK